MWEETCWQKTSVLYWQRKSDGHFIKDSKLPRRRTNVNSLHWYGDWTLIATDVSGDAQQMSCSLCGGVVVDEVDLADFIREQIPIDDLAVFVGGSEEEDT